jgi:hypothetical protein
MKELDKKYPNLFFRYSKEYPNFCVIAEVIEKYFSDLFDLSVLESHLNACSSGSYLRFFEDCLPRKKQIVIRKDPRSQADLFSKEKILQVIYQNLNTELNAKKGLTCQLVIKTQADVSGQLQLVSHQIGFYEKIVTGQLGLYDPLTFFDMVRILGHRYKSQSKDLGDRVYHHIVDFVAVVQLCYLEFVDVTKSYLLINFNLDIQGVPKWGIYNVADNIVYCEVVLTPTEKKKLIEKFRCKAINYQGGTTEQHISSGFSALAKLDECLQMGLLFAFSDFWNLRASIVYLFPHRCYFDFSNSEERFCDPHYKLLVVKFFTKVRAWRKYSLERGLGITPVIGCILLQSAFLGSFGGEKYCRHDIYEYIKTSLPFNSAAMIKETHLQAQMTCIVGFVFSMKRYTQSALLQEQADRVALHIPADLNPQHFAAAHKMTAILHPINDKIFRAILGDVPKSDELVKAMLLNIFRKCAKKTKLEISVAACFCIDQETRAFIVQMMQDNPFVTTIQVNQDNYSLQRLYQQLVPIFARNEWLARNYYKPPMIDDFWRVAAQYWLLYLIDNHDLFLDTESNQEFKQSIFLMGLEGLTAFLNYLSGLHTFSSENEAMRQYLEKTKKMTFYFFAEQEKSNLLLRYLHGKNYFPFNELIIAYPSKGKANYLMPLLNEVLQTANRFEKIFLVNFLRKHKGNHLIFLNTLLAEADREKWTHLLVIPELNDIERVEEQYRPLLNAYRLLSMVILRNRRVLFVQNKLMMLKKYTETYTQASIPDIIFPPSFPEIPLSFVNKQSGDASPWLLTKQGEVTRQLQIKQDFQQQQAKQTRKKHILQCNIVQPLPDIKELICYQNIDDQLADDFQDLCKKCVLSSFPESSIQSTPLQDVFVRWISANPHVNAKYVIHYITKHAGKILLRNNDHLASGLSIENLPEGFYTERDEHDCLVLCYDPLLGYATGETALTLDFNAIAPQAEVWLGDFRQFNFKRYINQKEGFLEKQDFYYMSVFAKLQIFYCSEDIDHAFEMFRQQNSEYFDDTFSIIEREDKIQTKNNIQKIKRYWIIFLQVWYFSGQEGIKQFLECDENLFIINNVDVLKCLLSIEENENLDEPTIELKIWKWLSCLSEAVLTDKLIRSLGQVYYQYGMEGLRVLCEQFFNLYEKLGLEFFETFNQAFLQPCNNLSYLLEAEQFKIFEEIIAFLYNNPEKKQQWQDISLRHSNTVPNQTIKKLWDGFQYFIEDEQIQTLGLPCDQFSAVPCGNMLVYMDRLLVLKKIPERNRKENFLELARKSKIDLSHGGAFYALQYEGFCVADESLQLKNFDKGMPTYLPDFSQLFEKKSDGDDFWDEANFVLYAKRLLASKQQCSKNINAIWQHFDPKDVGKGKEQAYSTEELKYHLILLLLTQYDFLQENDVYIALKKIITLRGNLQEGIAKNLYWYIQHSQQLTVLSINLDAIMFFQLHSEECLITHMFARKASESLLRKNIVFFESVTILQQIGRLQVNISEYEQLKQLLYSDFQNEDDTFSIDQCILFKCLVIFHEVNIRERGRLFTLFDILNTQAKQEARILFKQLLSIDWSKTNIESLRQEDGYQQFFLCLECFSELKNLPDLARIREDFIQQLTQKGVLLRYSSIGDYKRLEPVDRVNIDLSVFVDHEQRLWNFLSAHVIYESAKILPNALQPLLDFFEHLQFKRSYLNELEPLLAILEKAGKNKYWTVTHLNTVLHAFKPEQQGACYPVNMLEKLLNYQLEDGVYTYLSPVFFNQCCDDLPIDLLVFIQEVVKNTYYGREAQILLCQLGLREYVNNNHFALTIEIANTMENQYYTTQSHLFVLQWLINLDFSQVSQCWDVCKILLKQPKNIPILIQDWFRTLSLWLEKLDQESIQQGVKKIHYSLQAEAHEAKRCLIFHIVARSTLEQHFERKLNKLVEWLLNMEWVDLEKLAACYQSYPYPNADDLLRFIHAGNKQGKNLSDCIHDFALQPWMQPRKNFAKVTITRETDLERIFTQFLMSQGDTKKNLTLEMNVQLGLMFAYLKHLEDGKVFIFDYHKPIDQMLQDEINAAFLCLINRVKKNAKDNFARMQIWALLFTGIWRTTGKYPHLAQQFACIVSEVVLRSNFKLWQLSTGEGKSHVIALRAAWHVALGKKVDVCTAKPSLAVRDQQEYQNFFNYFHITSGYLSSASKRQIFEESDVIFTTMGDLSLFFDEQSYNGMPIQLNPGQRVVLLDEFDFIRFRENQNTQYNYAIFTGRTPKEMNWFYQAVNKFYDKNLRESITEPSKSEIKGLLSILREQAGISRAKLKFVETLANDNMLCLQWLKSARIAVQLERDIDYTVINQTFEIGGELLPMREVVPLTIDMQRADGSTFSAGVHQLLAAHLNQQAGKENKAQNHFVPAESDIINSQKASVCISKFWAIKEGFSGTISVAQACQLNKENGAEVLHVPTNQPVQRQWEKPVFFEEESEYFQAITSWLNDCLTSQKSVLLSCKNDFQVKVFKKKLKPRFSFSVWKNIDFYTNDDRRTPQQVLLEKQKKENFDGRHKMQGRGLVAAGFGRGDNCDIEEVLPVDVCDQNTFFQVAGRTGRNGVKGKVRQFYLIDDLRRERHHLLEMCRNLINDQQIFLNVSKVLEEVSGQDNNEKLHQQILLLREHVAILNSEADQAYTTQLANYCCWGMEILFKIKKLDDGDLHLRVSKWWSRYLQEIEKQRMEISAKVCSVEEKINAYEQCLIEYSNQFLKECISNKFSFSVRSFKPEKLPIFNKYLILGKEQIDPQYLFFAAIGKSLATFSSYELTEEKINKINRAVEIFSIQNNEDIFRYVIPMLVKSQTVNAFLNCLQPEGKQITAWIQERAQFVLRAEIPFDFCQNFFERGINSKEIDLFLRQLKQLPGAQFKEVLLDALKHSYGDQWRKDSISAIFPLLNYLGQFSVEQVCQWGYGYIQQVRLLSQDSSKLQKLRFSAMKYPMSAESSTQVWNLAKRNNNIKVNAWAEISANMEWIQTAIQESPEEGLQAISRWEDIVSSLSNDEKRSLFFNDFCRVMSKCSTSHAKSLFVLLVDKTYEWFNKGRYDSYQNDLIQLWQYLSKHEINENLCKLIHVLLKQPGKLWFQLLSCCVELEPVFLKENFDLLMKTIHELSDLHGKKHEQLNYVKNIIFKLQETQRCQWQWEIWCHEDKDLIEEISQQWDVFNGIFSGNDVLKDNLQRVLNQPKSAQAKLACLHYFNTNHEKIKRIGNKDLCDGLIYYFLSDDGNIKSIKTRQCISQNLFEYANLYENDQASLNDFLSYYSQFIDKMRLYDEKDLLIHLDLLKDLQKTTSIPLECLLRSNLVEHCYHLKKQTRYSFKKCIDTFHQMNKQHRGDIQHILADQRVKNLFDFNNKVMQTDRLVLMHALNNHAFVVNKENNGRGEYQWDEHTNDLLLKKGLSEYITETKMILNRKKRKLNCDIKYDLIPDEQKKLLILSRELQLIGGKQLDLNADSNLILGKLKKDLSTIQANYMSFWVIKSKQRQCTVDTLKEEINDIFNNADVRLEDEKCIQTRYERVLVAIREARKEAIASDYQVNQERRMFLSFYVNHKGYSRLQHTLNQMEDCVVRYWLQDQAAIQMFSRYEVNIKTKCTAILRGLQDELKRINDARWRGLQVAVNAFVLRPGEKQDNNDLLDHQKLLNLKNEIQKHRTKLPGHIKTLAEELLQPIDILRDYIVTPERSFVL